MLRIALDDEWFLLSIRKELESSFRLGYVLGTVLFMFLCDSIGV